MTTLFRGVGRAAFALLVAGGLAVGARSAMAAPAALACQFDPSRGWIGTSCSTNAYCTQACTAFYGYESPGKCLNGCCTCLF